MGREAEGQAEWQGQSGWVKALLESDVLILRGEVKLRLRRGSLTDWRAEGDCLVLRSGDGLLRLNLGATEAGRWVKALAKPLPTLAEKLGISAENPAFVIGGPEMAELTAALKGARAEGLAEAACLIAILCIPADLAMALTLGDRPIWCIHGKGRSAAVKDAEVRAAFRGAGWRDTKTSAVSEEWTATRYHKA